VKNFKQWLEDAGAVTSNLANTYKQDVFSKNIRSKYVTGGETQPESEFDPDKDFLGRRGKKEVEFVRSTRGKKYMKKKDMKSK